jgi:tRNA-specific 2-thiouridylase
MTRQRVVVAMSGGVDSSVAAARAVDAGHDVVGVHLALSRHPQAARTGARGCCTVEDARDARRAADVLGIPFYVWDLAERFQRDVIDDFVAEYEAGRTPNPCVRCNERVKFAALLDRVLGLGYDAVCTGHYARRVAAPEGWQLHRAVDPAKDQSYVLGSLTVDQLNGARFPLGDSTKAEVRAEAASRGLLVADKPDSHDICFIADGDTAGFLRGRLGPRPGRIVDGAGHTVGRHDGAYAFTVGQRRGLRLTEAAADRERRYVLSVEPATSTVTVGSRRDLQVRTVTALSPTWLSRPEHRFECSVQVRAHAAPVAATVSFVADRVDVDLEQPIDRVAPGQSLVMYDGSQVLGAATVAVAA